MLAAYIHSLREAVNRRMGLVLVGVGILLAYTFNHMLRVDALVPKNLSIVFINGNVLGPANLAGPSIFKYLIQNSTAIWIFLSVLAATPLLTSALEKGWVELTLTKGVPRWRVFLGHYFGGITLYTLTLVLILLPISLRLWWQTGVSPEPLIAGILLQVFSFAALMAIAALASLAQSGVGLPAMLTLGAFLVSPFLARRDAMFYPTFTSGWSRGLIDWVYRILPKTSEIEGQTLSYIQDHTITAWWPFWSTGLFLVCTLGLTLWLLHRKSM
jgi:ABC-type transport system involved in multi-copper enzyme maturation permease subunit